jgi:ankyrin repeat protein
MVALLDLGADVNAVDDYGNTPVSKAIFSHHTGRDPRPITLLIERGADLDRENKHGVSPLKLAQTIANSDVRQIVEAAMASHRAKGS